MRRHGVRLPDAIPHEDLPAALREVVGTGEVGGVPNLLVGGGPGLAPSMASGIYAPLRARGAIIGLVAIEHGTTHRYTQRDVELLSGFVEPAALALDNARWFARLRTVGADEERTRIARDLPTASASLWPLGFELDRIVTPTSGETPRTVPRPAPQRRRCVIAKSATPSTTSARRLRRAGPRSRAGALRPPGGERSGWSSRSTARRRRLPLSRGEMWRIAQEPGHVERTPRRPSSGRVALQRPRPPSRCWTTERASPPAPPDDSTPTGSSACGSVPRASAPPSRWPPRPVEGPGSLPPPTGNDMTSLWLLQRPHPPRRAPPWLSWPTITACCERVSGAR